ncbi:hypothetical protein E2C01_047230 [Portunus trituberculatus]|uniref:Uncharacterized protein n=1 Tax=Portunus trituberculatus TaxID=210409 RepID=A0A5B7G332_PORTR|nr:hypothetical protein [Portunus trituberculatus]
MRQGIVDVGKKTVPDHMNVWNVACEMWNLSWEKRSAWKCLLEEDDVRRTLCLDDRAHEKVTEVDEVDEWPVDDVPGAGSRSQCFSSGDCGHDSLLRLNQSGRVWWQWQCEQQPIHQSGRQGRQSGLQWLYIAPRETEHLCGEPGSEEKQG